MPLIHPFENVRAIFFDLDDTLCAYWEAAKQGLQRAFEDHPEHGQTPERMKEEWAIAFLAFVQTIGKTHWYDKYKLSGEITRVELMRRTLEGLGIYNDELAFRLSNTYCVERHAALELFPEALEVVESLSGAYTLGLITNGPADIQRQEIQKLNIGSYFQHVFIEGEVGFGKPDDRVFEMAKQAVGVEAHEILFVGNSYKHDIVPAAKHNWRTAWIRRPSDVAPSSSTGVPEERPEDGIVPDVTIESLLELLA